MPINPWKEDKSINDFIAKSGIEIKPLIETLIPEVLALTNKNKDRPGFFQMHQDVFNVDNSVYSQCLQRHHEMTCLLATDKSKGSIIGFVVIAYDAESAGIMELGVDQDAAFSKSRMEGPKNVGSALLLIACNELAHRSGAKEINVTASTRSAAQFYKKYKFTEDPDCDGYDELVLPKANYQALQEAILSRAKPKADNKNEFFQHSTDIPDKPAVTRNTPNKY